MSSAPQTSAPQTDHETMSESQLLKMLNKVKSSRQTEELRARLPAQLAPFASSIRITKPIQTTRTSPSDGVHWCACTVEERIISMSVVVDESLLSQSQDSLEADAAWEPYTMPLELVWRDWRTRSMYLTGSVDSHMHSISLQYGSDAHGMRLEAKAFTGRYDDPGMSETISTHGGIKSVVKQVVRDMGLLEGRLDNEVDVIEALLGDDGRKKLKKYAKDGTTLRKIIEDEMEEDKRS